MIKKKLTIAELIVLFRLLNSAKCDKMQYKERYALTKVLLAVQRKLRDYEELERETAKRLRPECYDNVAPLMAELAGMSEAERAEAVKSPKYAEAAKAHSEYVSAVDECLSSERTRQVEVEVEKMSDGWPERLFDSNPEWTVGQMAVVVDFIED